jgi:hypothetical protein
MRQPSASELGELEGRKSTLSCRWWNVRFAAIHRTIRAKRLFHMSCLSDRIRVRRLHLVKLSFCVASPDIGIAVSHLIPLPERNRENVCTPVTTFYRRAMPVALSKRLWDSEP